jgi:hypothetical protein
MPPNVTLLDLVNAVADHARSDAEVIAAVVWMVNSGRVRLCGTFVRRATPGTLVSLRENLGREPFTVSFERGYRGIATRRPPTRWRRGATWSSILVATRKPGPTPCPR